MIPYDYNNPNTAKYVKRTWGKHCNVLLFVSGDIDSELEPYVAEVNATETWTLVHGGLLHAFLFYGDKVDWFLRVEPSSFVVLENLRYMIDRRKYQPSQPIYFGYELENIYTHEAFIYAKSGYVISREALRRYTNASKEPNNKHCLHLEGFTEGLEVNRCLSHVNATIVDSRDEFGHETFIPINLDHQFLDGYDHIKWLHNLTYHKTDEKTVPISLGAIAFRVEYPPEMYDYYYFLYRMKVFGTFVPQSLEFGPQ
ncbi:hypothetical protein KR054_008016 [Drosophila jambulina]|nr:hypothetical protein KR054_008016 [Drosophila jambulina]